MIKIRVFLFIIRLNLYLSKSSLYKAFSLYSFSMKMKFLFLSLLLICGFYSCKRELEQPSWEVGVVGPVFHSSLGLNDLLADSLIQVNPDSSITLVYSGNIYKLALDTLLNLPDTTIADTFQLPAIVPSVNVAPGAQLFSQTDEQHFNAQGVELTQIDLERGFCYVTVFSTIDQPVDFTYEILSATKNGNHFSTVITVPAGSVANPSFTTSVLDLQGYSFDMIGQSGTDFNAYSTKIVIRMSNQAQPTQVHNYDKVIISSTYSDLFPSYAQGYFGHRTESIPGESTAFDLFEKIISGSIDINQVDVNLVIRNYVGADARITIQQLQASRGATSIDLNHSIIGSTININRATDPNGYPVPYNYSVHMDNGNSNIDQIIELLPTQFTTSLEMEINPLGNVAAHHDFIYGSHTVEADLNVELPLSLIANELTLVDTLHLSLSKGENGYVTEGNFTLDIENGFPFAGDVQLYFMDGNGTPTDSIVVPNSFSAGITNGSNIVIANSHSQIQVHLNTSQMDRLYAGDDVLLKVKFSTSSLLQHVDIYDYYRINIDLRGDFNYHIGKP